MEFYLKQNVYNQYVLANYSDLSRKVIYRSKLNQNVVLAKANPTRKACEKFLVNSILEFKLDFLPKLINTLHVVKPGAGQAFYILGQYENYKKDSIRLILRDSEYGGLEILQQKKAVMLEEEDMEFSDDPEPINVDDLNYSGPEEKWEDMFGVFFIKKNDKIEEITQVLNNFYVAAGGANVMKKRKQPLKKQVVEKKKTE